MALTPLSKDRMTEYGIIQAKQYLAPTTVATACAVTCCGNTGIEIPDRHRAIRKNTSPVGTSYGRWT